MSKTVTAIAAAAIVTLMLVLAATIMAHERRAILNTDGNGHDTSASGSSTTYPSGGSSDAGKISADPETAWAIAELQAATNSVYRDPTYGFTFSYPSALQLTRDTGADTNYNTEELDLVLTGGPTGGSPFYVMVGAATPMSISAYNNGCASYAAEAGEWP